MTDDHDDNGMTEDFSAAEGSAEKSEGDRPAREPADDDKPAAASAQPQLSAVINAFLAETYFGPATLGVQNLSTTHLARATGRVDSAVIQAALENYVAPGCFAAAATRLAQGRLVVLCGPPGIGKRSAALSLLREVTHEPLYMLSPQASLAELAKRDYDRGCGYLVLDRAKEGEHSELDFDWHVVRDRLEDNDAYLVVTTTLGRVDGTGSVGHVPWQAPDAARVLRAYWPHQWPEEHVELLREVLDGSERVADIVQLARRLEQGESPESAVTHFDARLREEVTTWFDAPRSRREILEVTTLAFTWGVDERAFESTLAVLQRILHEHMPEPVSDEAALVEDALPQRRKLLTANALIVNNRVPTELGTRGALSFAFPGYHRHVLVKLWERMEVAFWDAVREWLVTIVDDPQYEQRMAIGLAELADIALDEVLPLLTQWAGGDRGDAGQRVAVFTLWTMARWEQLAPTALQIATRWITRGGPRQRWVAAMTFSGQLGVRYPHDAMHNLWQLCVQAHTADGDVELVLAGLFSTLVRDTKDAGIVLSVLVTKLQKFAQQGAKPSMRTVAMSATLAVLSADDPVSNRNSFAAYLAEFPDRTQLVARLWSAVLANRPTRLRAIQALRAALEDLDRHASRPKDRARELGEALAARLAPYERAALEADFQTVVSRKGKDIGPLLATLLSALVNFRTDI
jgi:hypothetical protein